MELSVEQLCQDVNEKWRQLMRLKEEYENRKMCDTSFDPTEEVETEELITNAESLDRKIERK